MIMMSCRMKRLVCICLIMGCCCGLLKAVELKEWVLPFQDGSLHLTPLQDNAVRIRYVEGVVTDFPEWIYVGEGHSDIPCKKKVREGEIIFNMERMSISVCPSTHQILIRNKEGKIVFSAKGHELKQSTVQQEPTREATLIVDSPMDEYLYGLGQFQDGYLNVRGLTRRLTQVNTQIAIPFLLSNKGYGLLWNNYGLTNFNPADNRIEMIRENSVGELVTVDVTSTEGGRKEVRQDNLFKAQITVPSDGKYAVLLDVGQKMARRHHLNVDGKNVIDMRNLWLPPTTSILMDLKKGIHELTAELEKGDKPVVYYKKVDDYTVFHSPVAECVDYTVFVGTADEVISSYREVTGKVPMLPEWAFGYIHCRERYHSQNELLENARKFRQEQIPMDLIVQDWQYWGKYGWNAMKFDEQLYPNPERMVDELHGMNMKLMLSVWSKIDPNSEVGSMAQNQNYFIPGTTWIDFFDKDASAFYWKNFSERLLQPYKIDAWWQDATEPENDDLEGRRIMKGSQPGERFRNVYPLKVSEVVYNGLRKEDAERRAMIFTRSGFSGIQRYGSVMWSGDVGNDWKTLRYQIASGLNFVSTGLPWWTYDAGGFFRPGDQYTNKDYIERMIRWIQTSTFLPMMRVHGYQSDTEPWRYGEEAQRIITDYIRLRYRLLPYIYSEAAKVAYEGSTFMRPLVFDFPNDKEALEQKGEYMFGSSILVCPVTEKGVDQWTTYLPNHSEGWFDFWTGEKYEGKQWTNVSVNIEKIPIFVKAGSIIPMGVDRQFVSEKKGDPITFIVYPGKDASFLLYEDEGNNYNYESGAYSTIEFEWDDNRQTLTIGKCTGSFEGMQEERVFIIKLAGREQVVNYRGKKVECKF